MAKKNCKKKKCKSVAYNKFDSVSHAKRAHSQHASASKPVESLNSSKILDGGRSKNRTGLRRGYLFACRNLGRPKETSACRVTSLWIKSELKIDANPYMG